jgi:DNA-binding NarL/FixJ family response regulator
MHNILVVDDHPFFLHGFSQYLGDTNEFDVDTALSVDEAISKIDLARPDLAISSAALSECARNVSYGPYRSRADHRGDAPWHSGNRT